MREIGVRARKELKTDLPTGVHLVGSIGLLTADDVFRTCGQRLGRRLKRILLGYKGQYICVDPVSKLVMVHTAVEDPGYNDEPWALWSALVEQLG